tara:strand:- start:4047 stop:4739 length:693 start_codon:yes stop_codon:yes gene_type:complete
MKREPLKYYDILCIFLFMFQISSMLLGPRTIKIGFFELPGGILTYCMVFFTLNLLSEIYQAKRVKKLIYKLLICQLTFAAITFFVLKIHSLLSPGHDLAYQYIFTNTIVVLVIVGICSVPAERFNCYIYLLVFEKYDGRFLWLRNIVAVVVSELLFAIMWCYPFYTLTKGYGFLQITFIIISQSIFKGLFQIGSTPATYLCVWFLKNNEYDPLRNTSDSMINRLEDDASS